MSRQTRRLTLCRCFQYLIKVILFNKCELYVGQRKDRARLQGSALTMAVTTAATATLWNRFRIIIKSLDCWNSISGDDSIDDSSDDSGDDSSDDSSDGGSGLGADHRTLFTRHTEERRSVQHSGMSSPRVSPLSTCPALLVRLCGWRCITGASLHNKVCLDGIEFSICSKGLIS